MQQNPNPKILSFTSCKGKNYILIEGGWQIPCEASQVSKEFVGKRINVAQFKKTGQIKSCII